MQERGIRCNRPNITHHRSMLICLVHRVTGARF
jgi:hypothetical protein